MSRYADPAFTHEVYVIAITGAEKPCKIGISQDADLRVKQLQTGMPWTLDVMFSIPCKSKAEAESKERNLHREFAPWSLSGEWFDLTCNQIVGLDPLPEITIQ